MYFGAAPSCEHASCRARAPCSSLSLVKGIGTKYISSLHQEQHPAPSNRDEGMSRTTYHAAQVKMHKEGKPAPLSPLAAFSSDCRHGDKSLEAIPHHLHHMWVSGLQNK